MKTRSSSSPFGEAASPPAKDVFVLDHSLSHNKIGLLIGEESFPMDCFILIHKGEPELQRALEILLNAGIKAIAVGGSSDVDPNLWPQLQIEMDDFERAQTLLTAAGIDYARLPVNESILSGASAAAHS
jgi:hypothetical protein